MDEMSSGDEKPLKKRKIASGSQISQNSTRSQGQQSSPSRNCVSDQNSPAYRSRHPQLWFPDGLLILISSDGIAFKLHSGILSYHSEVFRERLDALTAAISSASQARTRGSSATNTYQEVTLELAEKGDELGEFFSIIYGGGLHVYCDLNTSIPFERFYRMLHLGITYKVKHIVDSGFARLERIFTSNYDEWIKQSWAFDQEPTDDPIQMQHKDTVAVVLLARAAGRTKILPVALYVCSFLDSTSVMEGVQYGTETAKLSLDDQKACFDAQRTLMQIDARIQRLLDDESVDGGRFPSCSSRCTDVYQKLVAEAKKAGVLHEGFCFTPWDWWIEATEAKLSQKRCPSCKEYAKKEMADRARQEWAKLGEIFHIPDWQADE